jgi:hypothetical protein
MTVSNPQGEKTSARRTKLSKRRKRKLRNTLINESKNTFEPQQAVSYFGDHLPKRLDLGQDAILIHDYKR